MNPLISVVVPVYKTEKYLSKCIESVLAQSYNNFELILVDDGSPDNSGKICDEYASNYSRIKVVHKENGGVSKARNTGLDIAQGEFITFLDSDDYLDCNALDVLYNTLIKENADLVCASHMTIRKMSRSSVSGLSYMTFSDDEVAANLFRIYISTPISCAKLYKVSVIKENNIRFVSGVPYAEDTYFLFCYIEHIKKVVFIPDVIYYYCRNNSTATKVFYLDIDKYNLYNFLKAKEIIDGSDLTDFEKQKILSDFANKICFENINHYMNFLKSKDIPLYKIADTFVFYKNYTDFTQNFSSSREISSYAVELLQKGDILQFINAWKRDNRIKILKQKAKILLTGN